MKLRIPMRLRVAWHALRGRPTIYRATFVGDMWIAPGVTNLLAVDYRIISDPAQGWELAR